MKFPLLKGNTFFILSELSQKVFVAICFVFDEVSNDQDDKDSEPLSPLSKPYT